MKITLVFLAGVCCCIVALIIAFPLYFAGYEPRVKWNKDLSTTTCVAVGHRVEPDTCSYSCNPQRHCSGTGKNRSCHTTYSTCYYDCFLASFVLEYMALEADDPTKRIEYRSAKRYGNEDTWSEADAALKEYWPIGKNVNCLYHRSEPSKMILTEYRATAFKVSAIFFFAFAGLSILVAGGSVVLAEM